MANTKSEFHMLLDKVLTEKNLKMAAWISFVVGATVFIVFIFLLAFHFSIALKNDELKMDATGQFGDFVGGVVGTLWALLASILLYLTLLKQEQNSKQANKAIALQQFDSMCFSLINLHNEMTRSLRENWIEIRWGKDQLKTQLLGTEIFEKVAIEFAEVFNNSSDYTKDQHSLSEIVYAKNLDPNGGRYGKNPPSDDILNLPIGKEKIAGLFDYYYSHHRTSLARYFRNMFQVVNAIHNYEGLDPFFETADQLRKAKQDKIRILRAQLSPYEIVLLWYNLQMDSSKEFYQLAIDAQLLKNIDFSTEIIMKELLLQQHPYLKE